MATAIYSHTQYSGIWSLGGQANAVAAATWPTGGRNPGAPTIGTATADSPYASVSFTTPADAGFPATITSFTVTSSPDGLTGTGASSPVAVSGAFTLDQAYTFTVTATNSNGTGTASAASNSIIPNQSLTLYTWGNNTYGGLGLSTAGAYTHRSSPSQVGGLTNWSKVSHGGGSGYAINNTGRLYSWGSNNRGALGLGNITYYSSPKQIGALTTWKNVFGGTYAYCMAIKTDGTLWSWGNGAHGCLGLGDTTNRSNPIQVGGLTDWLTVSCGLYSTLALKTNGTLWAWGQNTNGELGLGNRTDYSSPKQVGSLTNWSTISMSNDHALATTSDGKIYAWGVNTLGQLGQGNRTSYSSPKQVGSLTNWSQAGSGHETGFAIKTDGTLWGWGGNGNGPLGLGNETHYSSPKQVGALTSWTKMAEGPYKYYNFGAIQSGKLYMWGYGAGGQLGHNDRVNISSPKQVGTLTTWNTISSGGADGHAVALISV